MPRCAGTRRTGESCRSIVAHQGDTCGRCLPPSTAAPASGPAVSTLARSGRMDVMRTNVRPLPAVWEASVVGVSYRPDYPRNLQSLGEHDRVYLAPDPTNDSDPNAVGIYRAPRGELLGFLPRAIATRISEGDEHFVVTSHAVKTVPSAPDRPGLVVRVARVEWADDADTPVQVRPLAARSTAGLRRPPQEYVRKYVENALNEHLQPLPVSEDAWAVPSSTKPGQHYQVMVDRHSDPDAVAFMCSCPAGVYNGGKLHVSCRHAASVGLALERSGHLARTPVGWRVVR